MFKKPSLLLVISLLLLCSCTSKQEEEQNREIPGRVSYDFFDTVSYIYNYGNDSQDEFEDTSDAVFEILREYHYLTDIYHSYEGINNIYTINENAGDPVEVDERLIEFLKYCKELYYMTDGKTNILLGSVLKIWHAYREEGTSVPEYDLLSDANQHTDIELLEIDEENRTVTLLDENASIDVGAIAKGYATEKAAQYLAEAGKESYVLNIGGNIRIIGYKTDGSDWTTGVIDPNDTDNFAVHIHLADTAFVTSGDYIRYYVVDQKRYHHIIDPDTLFPADYFRSVSIYCSDSGMADALSTALFCMSYEDGLALAEKYGFGVIWIYADGTIKTTKNLENLIY